MAGQEIISILALVVSAVALVYSVKSAKAAEESNQHSKKSADAADVTGKITQASFENEAKRNKARAYWMLYRIHNLIMDRSVSLRPDLWDLSPIQDFLHVYGHTLNSEQRESIRRALNGVELLLVRVDPHPTDPDALAQQESIHRYVMDAAMALREEWMGRPAQDGGQEWLEK